MVGIGIMGCGSITKFRHAPEYGGNSNAKIQGFFDPIIDRAREMSNRYGGKVYNSYEDMLADPAVDAVSVCTANKFHAPISIAALKAGKHVLCEKPMATSIAEAEEMIAAAKEAGKFLMIGHNQRLVEAHKKARQILLRGELGRIISFSTTFSHAGPEMWSADKSVKTWFFNKSDAFMGAMGDLGIHKADLIRWLIGDEIREVMAHVCTLDKKGPDGRLIEIDDNAVCVLISRSGIVGTLSAGWTNYGDENNSTVLYCSEGVMKIYDNPEFPVEVVKKDGEKVYYKIGGIQTNANQTKSGVIDQFIESIEADREPEISGGEGLAALKIIFACFDSSASGKKIILE